VNVFWASPVAAFVQAVENLPHKLVLGNGGSCCDDRFFIFFSVQQIRQRAIDYPRLAFKQPTDRIIATQFSPCRCSLATFAAFSHGGPQRLLSCRLPKAFGLAFSLLGFSFEAEVSPQRRNLQKRLGESWLVFSDFEYSCLKLRTVKYGYG